MRARHGGKAANHNSTHFFGVVDLTLTHTHLFWSTGWEVISKFPSNSSLVTTQEVVVLFPPLSDVASHLFTGEGKCPED